MADYVKRARKIVKDVMDEFEPAGEHAVSAGRQMLLALRAAVDAEINLYDRATRKKRGEGKEVKAEPLAQPGKPDQGE